MKVPWVWVNEFFPLANQTSTGSPYYNPWTSTATTMTITSSSMNIVTPLHIPSHIPSLIWINTVGQTELPRVEIPDVPDLPRLQRERVQRETVSATVQARENAEAFLLRHLSEEQRNSFIAAGFFVVIGQRTRKKYRIEKHSFSGNIHEMNAHDQVTHRLCCHLAGNIPLADHLLAQKLSLEADEETFLRLANRNEVVRR